MSDQYDKQHLTFSVPGSPKPKERPRFGKGLTYTAKGTRDYEKTVQVSAMKALTQWRIENQGRHWTGVGRFSLNCFLFFDDRRKRDIDNCLKSISDALNGMLYDDDHQIDEIYAYRDYDRHEPRAVVTVRRLSIAGKEKKR